MIFKRILAFVLLPCLAIAGGSFVVEVANVSGTTTTVSSSNVEGYIESIHIDVTGVTTGTLVISTADEVVFTSSVTNDASYRPRVADHATDGTAINVSNMSSRVYLDNEKLTFSLAETAVVTNTYKVKVKVVKQQR